MSRGCKTSVKNKLDFTNLQNFKKYFFRLAPERATVAVIIMGTKETV